MHPVLCDLGGGGCCQTQGVEGDVAAEIVAADLWQRWERCPT